LNFKEKPKVKNYIDQQFGNYRLIRLIGQGGFADVYLGQHIHLNTQAAIKVLQMRVIGSNTEQFRNEARTIASLLHPNIIRVLDFGIEDGIPFLVMDYAPNGTLRQHSPKGVPLPPATFLPYVKQIASALQYAHDRKFIHRDVKPENMLLGRNNEVLLSDFGLVLIAQSTGSRSIQEMGGTVAYMAPEQLQGKPRPASDQYALGITVYEWLSGERPFNGSFVEIASQQMLTPPPPLHVKVAGLSPAVEQVILTALAKDPKERFASVQAFATALEQACLDTSPASLTPPFADPHLLSQSSQPTYITPSRQPSPLLANTPQLSQSSEPTYITPTDQPSQPTFTNTRQAGPPTMLSTGGDVNLRPSLSPIAEHALEKQERSRQGISRRTVVVSLASILGLGLGGGAIAWAASGGLQKLGFMPTPISTPIVTPRPDPQPDPDPQSTADPQPSPFLGTILVTYHGHSKAAWTAAWSPNGQFIASGGDDGTAQIWNPTTGKQIFTYNGYAGTGQYIEVVTLAWSPDGKRIVSSATVSGPGPNLPDVRVWDASTGKTLVSYKGHLPQTAGHSNVVGQVAWSPDGTLIASAGGYDKTVQVWDASTGRTILTYRGHSFDVWKVQWSPAGKYIASASGDPNTPSTGGDIQVWDINGNRTVTYTGHSVEVTDIAWSPDGTSIVSAGRDGTIQIWNASTGHNILTYSGGEPVGWSPNGKRIVSSAVFLDHTAQIRDALTGNNPYIYHGYSSQINVLAWSPDNTRIVLAGLDGTIQVWQAE
jgi:serine/threonine protein kinase